MSQVTAEIPTVQLKVPIAGGEVSLQVPAEVSEPTLLKEIGVQDLLRKRLLGFIDGLDRIIESNRELFFCSEVKLGMMARAFLAACVELKRFMAALSEHHSAIAELAEARDNVRGFFFGHIAEEIAKTEALHRELAPAFTGDARPDRRKLDLMRRLLGKTAGRVRTELQKIFAHLMARDPRNLYRVSGAKTEQEILFLQFRPEVERTEQLYGAVRGLDTYLRGAIIPSDLLKLTAGRIEGRRSVGCLFEPDYSLFLNSLLDEISEQLLTELYTILDMDGIWYDDYENVRGKAKMLSDVCSTFKALYLERCGLRAEVQAKVAAVQGKESNGFHGKLEGILAVFNTYRYQEVAGTIRYIDQILVDLEGALLQWEKGIAKRAFAKSEWSADLPFQRREGGATKKAAS